MTRAAAALILAVSMLGSACAGAGVAPSAAPSAASTLELRLTTDVAEGCGSIGGCAGYWSLEGPGRDATAETRISQMDTASFSIPLAAADYTLRIRLVAVSDDIAVGQAPDETTIGSCSARFRAASPVVASVVFRGSECDIAVG